VFLFDVLLFTDTTLAVHCAIFGKRLIVISSAATTATSTFAYPLQYDASHRTKLFPLGGCKVAVGVGYVNVSRMHEGVCLLVRPRLPRPRPVIQTLCWPERPPRPRPPRSTLDPAALILQRYPPVAWLLAYACCAFACLLEIHGDMNSQALSSCTACCAILWLF
jgi:hypothetical protein